jgi:hypothetical protein
LKAFTLLIGLAIAALGAVGLFMPELILDISRRLATPGGLYVAAAIRVGVGILLLGLAGRSRSPVGLRILGAFTFLAGLVTPLIGADRAQAYIEWWSARGPLVLRLWSVLAVAIGLFIAWAVIPQRRRRLRPAHP